MAFVVCCVSVAAIHFVMLTQRQAPVGVDGGNWLAFAHALTGASVRSSTIIYPPVVPLLVEGAVAALGPVSGVGLIGAVVALAPGAAVFAVLRSNGLRWPAVAIGGVLLTAGSVGEATAWGGYPQLLGLGLAVLFLLALQRWISEGGVPRAVCAGALLALLLATSHLLALLAIVAALVVGTAMLADGRLRPAGRPRLGELVVVAAPSLALVPLYVSLARGLAPALDGRRSELSLTVSNAIANLHTVVPELPWVWYAIFALAVLAPVAGWKSRDGLWLVSTSSLVAAVVVVVATREPRYLYALPVLSALSLGSWLRRVRPSAMMACALVGCTVALSGFGLERFAEQRDRYTVVTSGVLEGIEWLRTNTPADARIVVTAVRDAPLGWWVEGLGQRRTFTDAPLRWLNFEDEQRRARQALYVLGDGFERPGPDEGTLERARAANADYVLVAKSWRGYSDSAAALLRLHHPASVAMENGSVLILRIP